MIRRSLREQPTCWRGNNLTVRGCRSGSLALLCVAVLVACRSATQAPNCEVGQLEPCERACERGDNAACELLTEMYLRGVGVERSEEQAAKLNKRLCESGRRYFCPTYAFVLFVGRGVTMDRARARVLFAENCQHDPRACSEYGSLIAVGTGVPRDLELGVFLLELACRERDALACRDLQELEARGLRRQPAADQ